MQIFINKDKTLENVNSIIDNWRTRFNDLFVEISNDYIREKFPDGENNINITLISLSSTILKASINIIKNDGTKISYPFVLDIKNREVSIIKIGTCMIKIYTPYQLFVDLFLFILQNNDFDDAVNEFENEVEEALQNSQYNDEINDSTDSSY